MPGLKCKSVVCSGSCLDAIVVDNAREMTEVAVKLAASGSLSDGQMNDLICVYEEFEHDVKLRKRQDRILRDKVKSILLA